MSTEIARIPDGWWLHHLAEERTEVIYRGDTHKPTGRWVCELQHDIGGRLKRAHGTSPSEALENAIKLTTKEPA